MYSNNMINLSDIFLFYLEFGMREGKRVVLGLSVDPERGLYYL